MSKHPPPPASATLRRHGVRRRVVRTITYEGPPDWVEEVLARSLKTDALGLYSVGPGTITIHTVTDTITEEPHR